MILASTASPRRRGRRDLPQVLPRLGLKLVRESGDALDFETLNGCEVHVRHEEDPTLPPAIEDLPTVREVVWGVAARADIDRMRGLLGADGHYVERYGTLHATDPNGLAIAIRVTHKRAVDVKGVPINAWGQPGRGVNLRSRFYERAEPIEVGHVVFFTNVLAETERFYVEKLGFAVSDRYPGRGVFLRCAPGGQASRSLPPACPGRKPGINHVAFAVRSVHEVFGGSTSPLRLAHRDRPGPASDLVGLLLVREEPRRRARRVLHRRGPGRRRLAAARVPGVAGGVRGMGGDGRHRRQHAPAEPRPGVRCRTASTSSSAAAPSSTGPVRRASPRTSPCRAIASCASGSSTARGRAGARRRRVVAPGLSTPTRTMIA
jgi:catechol 2,3-dioxygenase-like lactoylglutathione lyase family enzyme